MKEKLSKVVTIVEKILCKGMSVCISAIVTAIWTLLWFPVAIKMAFSESYYPEKPRKSLGIRLLENIYWVLRFHRANGFYSLYGMDVKGTKIKNYIDEKTFWKGLDRLNYCKGAFSQVSLLKDKFMFYKYMSASHIPVPEVFGIIRDGRLYDCDLKECDYNYLETERDYFIKDINGECASFVKHINDVADLEKIKTTLSKGSYILQRRVFQIHEMSRLNPNAINTLRVITIYNNGRPFVLSSLLRVGTNTSGSVDNWAAGGLAIGIEQSGNLKEFGLYKPGHGLKENVHPDTGVVFSEFKIPKLREAYDLACEAHKVFYDIGAIGWDIAITDNGPVFIEGNDNFEITLMQACDRPLKKEWKEILNKLNQ